MLHAIGAAIAAAAVLVAANASAANKEFEGVTIRINGFGGPYDEALKKAVANPIKEKFGINVVYEPGTAAEAVSKLLANKGSPHLDLLMIDSPNMPVVIENGVVEEISEAEVPALRDLHRQAREFGNYGASFQFAPIVLSYNKQRIKDPPSSLKDLARPEYKNQAAMFSLGNNGGILTLIALAEADGGGVNNIAPGFEMLKKIKPNLVATPAANSALNQLFEQNEATVAANWSGRSLNLAAAGFPVEMVVPKEGLYAVATYTNVVKGSKNRAAALKYIERQASPEAQLEFTQVFFYPPTNAKVKLPDDLAKKVLLYGPSVEKARMLDWAVVAKQRSAWLEEWNRIMGQ
jgi:putative spermidine/putrescine transport system substrate-binding protein